MLIIHNVVTLYWPSVSVTHNWLWGPDHGSQTRTMVAAGLMEDPPPHGRLSMPILTIMYLLTRSGGTFLYSIDHVTKSYMKSRSHENYQSYLYIGFRAKETISCLSCSSQGSNILSNHEGSTTVGADSSLYGLQLGTII